MMRIEKMLSSMLAVLMVFFYATSSWSAQINREIYFTRSVPLTVPQKYTLRFSLWTGNEQDAEATQVWSEEKEIMLNNSILKTSLGNVVPLDEGLFVEQLWVQVETVTPPNVYEVVGKRALLNVVPYALFSLNNGATPGVSSVSVGTGLVGTGQTGSVKIEPNFGTGLNQIARGQHSHDNRYYTKAYIDALEARIANLEGVSNTPPVADAGTEQNVQVGSTVILDGSKSSDPENNALSYSWSLQSKPAESTAILSGANKVNPDFVADKIGPYVVSLIVNDGKTNSLPDSVTIKAAASNSPPVAQVGPNKNAVAGPASVVELDASKSSDPDGDTLSFQWTFLTKPPSSKATLSDDKAIKPTFIADVAGIYTFGLLVNDGTAESQSATLSVNAYRAVHKFNFTVVDAEYSEQLEKIVIVSTTPANKLHIYDPVSKQNMAVALNLTPTSVSVSPDGLFAVVGHNAYICQPFPL